tara:strand:- start:181 stop:1635 length:1455 start_codon:yes stop_codon:yes gene_type:complete
LGVIFKQSFRNTLIIFAAFAIGGVNTLFLYTQFLQDKYYGLVTFLLSSANLLMPLTAFGIQYTIVKFYSGYESKLQRDKFLSMALFLPLFIALPLGFLATVFYDQIGVFLSKENIIIKDYTFVIYLVAIATAYFEIFYSWSKVQLKSVFGNFIKELYNRLVIMLLLFLVFLEVLTKDEFIYYLTASYFLRTLIMMLYAFKLYLPKFTFSLPDNFKEIIKYSAYIILAGSASAILIDIDKVMLPGKKELEIAAYYTVAVFIGSSIEAPGRAMYQILQPLTSKALNEKNYKEVNKLYKQSSINLALICGLFFLLINLNLHELYQLLPQKYSGGALVVLMISTAKLYTMFLGSNGAIISNSKYYKILLPYGVIMAITVGLLNYYMIDWIGMNGAALSTLIVILLFNTLKVWYVNAKFSMIPFSKKTLQVLLCIAFIFGIFYFINFNFHPIINIALKSVLISVSYLLLVKQLHISKEINDLIKRYLRF